MRNPPTFPRAAALAAARFNTTRHEWPWEWPPQTRPIRKKNAVVDTRDLKHLNKKTTRTRKTPQNEIKNITHNVGIACCGWNRIRHYRSYLYHQQHLYWCQCQYLYFKGQRLSRRRSAGWRRPRPPGWKLLCAG